MGDEQRLIGCFQTVFPELSAAEIPSASQATVETWDSIAAITLVNVIEEEFQIQMDFDMLGELDSFPKILKYIEQQKVS